MFAGLAIYTANIWGLIEILDLNTLEQSKTFRSRERRTRPFEGLYSGRLGAACGFLPDKNLVGLCIGATFIM